MSKVEALRYPVVGTYLRLCGHLTVDRFDARQSVKVADLVARSVQGGQSVLVFPEGTFTPEDGVRPFRMGVFKTAVETGVPAESQPPPLSSLSATAHAEQHEHLHSDGE